MKLNLIKIASLIMVLSMVFALAIPAFAEGEEPTTYVMNIHMGPRYMPIYAEAGDTLTAALEKNFVMAPAVEFVGDDTPEDQLRVFQGWSTTQVDGKGTSEGLVDENTVVSANMDLYPVYSYVVTLHIGAREPISVPVFENETLWVLDTYGRVAPFVDDQDRPLQGWFSHGVKVTSDTVVTGNMDVYAKYSDNITIGDKVINKKMIDVKYQLAEGDYDNTADIRFVTSIDSLEYKSVSFKITLDGTVYTLTSNNAYTALSGEDRSPAQAFVAASQYFVAYTITNLPTDLYTEISAQAVLELMDGTLVEGNVCFVAFN